MMLTTKNSLEPSSLFSSHPAFHCILLQPLWLLSCEEMLRSLILLVVILVIFHFEHGSNFNSAFFLFIIFNPLYPSYEMVESSQFIMILIKLSINRVRICASIIFLHFYLSIICHILYLKYTVDLLVINLIITFGFI